MWSDPTFYAGFGTIAVIFIGFIVDQWLAWRRGTPPPPVQQRCRHCCCECPCHSGHGGHWNPHQPRCDAVAGKPVGADHQTHGGEQGRSDGGHQREAVVTQATQIPLTQNVGEQQHRDDHGHGAAPVRCHGTDPSAVDVDSLIRKLDFTAMRP